MVFDGMERAIQHVNKWGASRNLKAGYVVVADSIDILHERA